MKRILIAGIGNIFFGDDAFGPEVIAALHRRGLPDGVEAIDFGVRSYDLAFALTQPYAAVILVDATPRGEAPGTTFLLQLDLENLAAPEADASDAHRANPVTALQVARRFGEVPARLYLVGCEPAVLECESGQIGLSPGVQAAVPRALELVEEVLAGFREEAPFSVAGS